MKPDLIVTWPTACDYPLWRKFIREERDRFERVVACFSDQADIEADYLRFVRTHLQGADVKVWPSSFRGEQDWRDCAVNEALEFCESEWVWFTEQDFTVTDPAFWDGIQLAMDLYDVIGWVDEPSEPARRAHPCCLFVRRSEVEKTSRNFAPTQGGDHFWVFCQELLENGARFVDFHRSLGLGFHHMAGLSHNHILVARGQDVTYNPDEFRAYLRRCLDSGEPLEPSWQREVEEYVRQHD